MYRAARTVVERHVMEVERPLYQVNVVPVGLLHVDSDEAPFRLECLPDLFPTNLQPQMALLAQACTLNDKVSRILCRPAAPT
jgi:hypothetical protein